MEKVRVRNYLDAVKAAESEIEPDAVRTATVEALVDTGGTYLSLPPSVIRRLGLSPLEPHRVMTANGIVERRVFGGAEFTIKGRTEQMSVLENDETTPPLIGYLVLEVLDFVVDPKSQELIPNPAHEGKWILDLFSAQIA